MACKTDGGKKKKIVKMCQEIRHKWLIWNFQRLRTLTMRWGWNYTDGSNTTKVITIQTAMGLW
jgi:hypothetical protein